MAGIIELLGYLAALYLSYHLAKTIQFLYSRLLAAPVDVSRLGKWGVVTGSTDGIGKAYAFALAKAGLNVVLVSRSASKLQTVAVEIEEKYRVKTMTLEVDFTADDREYIPRLEKELAEMEIGVLVNNVGMSYEFPMPFLDMEGGEALVRRLVEVNVTSTNAMTRLVLPSMVARRKGAVVNVGSISALLPSPMYSVYAATKAYVVKLSEALNIEYGPSGITVQCVNPGYVVSNMSKLRKPTLMAPTPEVFVRSALGRLGICSVTYGYWVHDLLAAVFHALPEGLAVKILRDQIVDIRKRALKKRERDQAKVAQ